jgi:hypothetical protein
VSAWWWLLAYIAVAAVFLGFLWALVPKRSGAEEGVALFAAAFWPLTLLVVVGMRLGRMASWLAQQAGWRES